MHVAALDCRLWHAEPCATLVIHSGGHVFEGKPAFPVWERVLKP